MTNFEKQVLLSKYKTQAESPYNDGWTQEFYRKEYEKLLNTIDDEDMVLGHS